MSRASQVVHTWRAPLALAAASAVGLTSALLSDGAGDVLAWLALGAPVVVVAWCVLPRVQRQYFRSGIE
ncbi:MAG TPA: hypothetical protein VMG12_32930 [Polyangiaceae bacterium]|nr:hypothetical protein [Polyangiaceae bacterium]